MLSVIMFWCWELPACRPRFTQVWLLRGCSKPHGETLLHDDSSTLGTDEEYLSAHEDP